MHSVTEMDVLCCEAWDFPPSKWEFLRHMSWDLRASERSRVLAFMFLPPTHCLQGLGLPQPPWNVPSSWHSPVPKQRAGVVWTSVGHLAFFGSGVLLACLCHFFFRINLGLQKDQRRLCSFDTYSGRKKIRGKSDICIVGRNQ